MPCSSGEEICHPFVGQIGSVALWACSAPPQIEAPNRSAPNAAAREALSAGGKEIIVLQFMGLQRYLPLISLKSFTIAE
jgi:hypothetical protein